MSSAYTSARIEHSEAIETSVDDIMDIILSDNNVSTNPDNEGTPVSTETWLAAKAVILKLLAEIAEED